jgi:hypothetical protein
MRMVALIVALGLCAAIGACGSDEKRDRDRGPDRAAQQAEAFQKRADAICRDVVDREILMEARIDEEQRTKPEAAHDRLEARLFRRYEGFVKELAGSLEGLEGEAPDKGALRAYVSHLRKLAATSRSTAKAVGAARHERALAGFDRIALQLKRGDELAERLKLPACGELSSPTLTGKA